LIKTEKCGFGLVAVDEIKKGEFVIEYVGEVIDDRTCEERLWKMKRQRYTNFYLCEVSSNMVIDATNKGNKSRFINHSSEPNTEMQKWTVDGETRVGIFSLRDIKKGEELTYDYKYVRPISWLLYISPTFIYHIVYTKLFLLAILCPYLTGLSSLEQIKIVIVDLQTAEKGLAHLSRSTQLSFTMATQEAHKISVI